jgi:acyl carrier protein
MNRKEILNVIIESICEETEFEFGESITEQTIANDVPGWDSLAHVRIMFNIDISLGTEVPIESTYGANNIGDLISLYEKALK